MGDVQASQGVSASEMTYIVSGRALYSTHSLTDGSAAIEHSPACKRSPIPVLAAVDVEGNAVGHTAIRSSTARARRNPAKSLFAVYVSHPPATTEG